jgi:hypothetical protein
VYARFWWRNNEAGNEAYYLSEQTGERIYVDVVFEPHDADVPTEIGLRVCSDPDDPRPAQPIREAAELDANRQPKVPTRRRFHFQLERCRAWPFEVRVQVVLPAAHAPSAPVSLDGSLTVVPKRSRTAARWLATAALACWIYLLWLVNLTSPDEPMLKLQANAIAVLGGVGAPLVASFSSRSRLPQLGLLLDWRWACAVLLTFASVLVVARCAPFIVWVDNRTGRDLEFEHGRAPSGQRALLFGSESQIRDGLESFCVDQDCHFTKDPPLSHFWERLVFFAPQVVVGCRKLGVAPAGTPSVAPSESCSFAAAQLELDVRQNSGRNALGGVLAARNLRSEPGAQTVRLALPETTARTLLDMGAVWDLTQALGANVFVEFDHPRQGFDLTFRGQDVVRDVHAPMGAGLFLTPALIDASRVATLNAQVTRRDSPQEVSSLSCTVPMNTTEPVTILVPQPRSSAYLTRLVVIDGSLTVSHWHAQNPDLTPLALACKARPSEALLMDGIPDQVVLFLNEAWYPEQRWRFEFPAPVPLQFTIYSSETRALGTLRCNLPSEVGGVEVGPVALASTDRKPANHVEIWPGARQGDASSVWDVAESAPAYLKLWPWACSARGAPSGGAATQKLEPSAVVDGRKARLSTDGIVFDTFDKSPCNIVKARLKILGRTQGYECRPDHGMKTWLDQNRGFSRALESCDDSSRSCIEAG